MEFQTAASDSTAWKVIVATAVGWTIATTAIILRLASRWLCRKRLELNDYLILIAYIFKLGIDIGSILLVCYGIGRDYLTVSNMDLVKYLKVLYAGPMFYAGCIGFTKLSILALYWSAFPARYLRIGVYILSPIVVAWTIAVIIVAIRPCNPIAKSWAPMTAGTCINYSAYYYGSQIPNVLTDFAILFLPLKAVWDLQMPMRQTIQLSAVLSLAVLTCAFDIIRLAVLVKLKNGGNFTKAMVGLSIWTNLEPSIAILVACMIVMRPLLTPHKFMRLRNQPFPSQEMDYRDDAVPGLNPKDDFDTSSEPVSSNESPSRNL